MTYKLLMKMLQRKERMVVFVNYKLNNTNLIVGVYGRVYFIRVIRVIRSSTTQFVGVCTSFV